MRRPATLQLEEYDPAAEVLKRIRDDETAAELADLLDRGPEEATVADYLRKATLKLRRRGEMPKTGTVH